MGRLGVSAAERIYDARAMEASEPKPVSTPPAASTPPPAGNASGGTPPVPKPPASTAPAGQDTPQHEGVQQSEEDKLNERHGVAGWKERAIRFEGVSTHAIAGALHGLEADERITEDEVRQRLEAFHNRPGVEASE